MCQKSVKGVLYISSIKFNNKKAEICFAILISEFNNVDFCEYGAGIFSTGILNFI